MNIAKATIGSKIKRVIATALLATTLATSISLSPARALEVQAKASEAGHTKKVSMQPFIFSEQENSDTLLLQPKTIGKLDAIIKTCGINRNITEYEAVERFNDWITKNIKYDYDYINTGATTLFDTLKYKKGVCADYARLFTALCDRVGIKSTIVDSATHAWNMVQVDGVWYHIDTCWNACWVSADPKKWFLLSESEILKDHQPIEGVLRNESYFAQYAYTETKCTIKYNLKGGTNNKSNIKTYYVSGSKEEGTAIYSKAQRKGTSLDTFKFKNPTKKGYIFKGWYNGKKKVTKLSQVAGKQNVTLTAKWTKVSKPTLKNVKMTLKTKEVFTNFYRDEIKLTWKKEADTHYEIKCDSEVKYAQNDYYTKYSNTYKTTKNTISITVSQGAKYTITVRAYKQDSTGKKTYSKAKTFTNK